MRLKTILMDIANIMPVKVQEIRTVKISKAAVPQPFKEPKDKIGLQKKPKKQTPTELLWNTIFNGKMPLGFGFLDACDYAGQLKGSIIPDDQKLVIVNGILRRYRFMPWGQKREAIKAILMRAAGLSLE